MNTYTVTAKFHIEVDANYGDMINFVESMMPNTSGVYFVQFSDIEEN
jgi:hypothetical protein